MKKPPIIILHGWGSSSAAWETPKKLLEKEGLEVFVPDLPGFGKEPPPKIPWSVSNYVDFVLRFARENGLDKFVLIGYSFGGRVAIKLAAEYPEKVERLILTGVPVGQRKTLKASIFNLLAKIGKVFFWFPPLSFFTPLARKFLYYLASEWDYYKTTGVMRQVFKNVINEDLAPLLFKINLPTLILWGKEDKVTPVSFAHFFKEKVSQAKLVILPAVSHKLPYENPEVFVKEIEKFLS